MKHVQVNVYMTENKYDLVEIFYSVQGEGFRMGTQNIFVRFSHCNLSCSFCDTPYNEINLVLSEKELIEKISSFPCKNIIFTGGEPTLALTRSLVEILKKKDYFLAIETNGMLLVPEGIDWITVSPKTGMNTIQQKTGNELKIVFGTQKNLDEWLNLDFEQFYLSPENDYSNLNLDNNIEVIEYIKHHHQWRFTTQIHKVLGIS